MNRSVPVLLAVLLVLAAAALLLLSHSDEPGDALLQGGTNRELAAAGAVPDPGAGPSAPAIEPSEAERIAADLDGPPVSYRAALGGLIGRVVDSRYTPLAGLRIELLGGNFFDLLPTEEALLADEPPDFTFGIAESTTDVAGRFRFEGIDPHGFFLLAIDLEGPRATYRPVDATPNAGEVVDLGDVVLAPYVTLLGRVIDEDETPVAGARVRATELPPDPFMFGLGDVVPGAAVGGTIPGVDSWMVLPVPPIVTSIISRIPYRETTTASDGTFRLEGVPIGKVTVLVDHGQMVSLVKGPIATGDEGERYLGDLSLLFGDELVGRVVNGADEPVAGAEVMAGPRVPFVPAALLLPVGKTDENGVFRAEGLSDQAHVVAARARDATRWAIKGGVFPGLDEPVLRLADTYALCVTARNEAGEIIRHPRLSVQQADVLVDIMLVVPPLPLAGRVEKREDGSVVVTGLSNGKYNVFVRAPGFAVGKVEAEISGERHDVELVLEPEITGSVQVVAAHTGEPVEYALVMVYGAQTEEENPLDLSPRITRRTDRNGVAFLEGLEVGEQRVRVFHPAYAMESAAIVSPGPPILVELSRGGSIFGTVLRDGVPVSDPHWVFSLPKDEDMTPLPRLTRTGEGGTYRLSHLKTGEYKVAAARPLNMDGRGSRGFLVDYSSSSAGRDSGAGSTDVRVSGDSAMGTERQAHVLEGLETRLDIDLLRIEGNFPKARLLGRVYLNGSPGGGLLVIARAAIEGRTKRSGTTDASGQFDVGEVPAGELTVTVCRGTDEESGALAIRTLRLEPNAVANEEFLIETGWIEGRVLSAEDGSPVPFASVDLLRGGEDDADLVQVRRATLEDGTFLLDVVPAGSYVVLAEKPGFARATSDPVTVLARGAPPTVVLTLLGAVTVSGSVSPPPEAGPTPILFIYFDGHDSDGLGAFCLTDPEDGSFQLENVAPGTYDVLFYGAAKDLRVKDLEVPPTGLSGVVLYPEVAEEDE